MKKSALKRWLGRSISVVLIIIVLIVALMSIITMQYYYNAMEQSITGYAIAFENSLDSNLNSEDSFIYTASDYVKNFLYKDKMELVLFNSNDDVVLTSTGFNFESENKDCFLDDGNLKGNFIVYTGQGQTNEKIMCVTKKVYSVSGSYLGAVSFMVSLDNVDYQIMIITFIFVAIAIFISAISILINSYFLTDIINSVKNISAMSKQITRGKFESRIEKKYDDEIGELCDTINHMARELDETEKMKNDFISSVSHELRTPLTAINGWAETMKLSEMSDKDTMQKGLNIIIKETGRLSGLVEELLDFSRMQNNKMVLMLEKMDLLADLDETVYIYNERAMAEDKHIVLEAPETISPVLGDTNRLKQVFANLIDNSLKYTEKNGVITVSVEEKDDRVYVMIRDNGCGIPKEHLPKVTEKFYKVNNTQRGSGIGLSVVSEIINLHSGTFNIESTEGEGTTVILSIPTLKQEI